MLSSSDLRYAVLVYASLRYNMLAYALFPTLPDAILAYARAQHARGRRPFAIGLGVSIRIMTLMLFNSKFMTHN